MIERQIVSKRVGIFVFLMLFLIILWLTQPFLLFHTVAEFVSIFLAMSLFLLGTQSYKYSKNDTLYFLSLAFFFISVFDGVHTLAHNGMNLIPGASTNTALQLWISGRLLQIVTLCMIPFLHQYTIRKRYQEMLFIVISGLMGVLIITDHFPTCYVEGVGQTFFKKAVEYVIMALSIVAFFVVKKMNLIQSKRVLLYVRYSLIFIAASALSFSVHKDVYGATNALGHLLKIASYLFMWIMVVEEGFAKPYDHMFKRIYDNSIHDQLTGLYNRRYYEASIKNNVKDAYPFSLVVADIDGLKLINDAFGHAEGDRAITCFAQLLKEKCRSTDKIVRMGGDEFFILMPHTLNHVAQTVIQEIVSGYKLHQIAGIPLSASFGCMDTNGDRLDWNELFTCAEAKMYRQKLSGSMVLKSRIIYQVMQSIFERCKWAETHSNNVASLSKAIAIRMNLSDSQIDDVFKAGSMHDIGMVKLSKEVLNKETELTEIEILEMQRHVEIGYNLLSQVTEYSKLANFVLFHHENWDGSGYPLGLSRMEIPLPSRIIAVAEAFDAMVSERPYGINLSIQDAVEEINNSAGTKFDTEVVITFKKVIELDWHSDDNPSYSRATRSPVK